MRIILSLCFTQEELFYEITLNETTFNHTQSLIFTDGIYYTYTTGRIYYKIYLVMSNVTWYAEQQFLTAFYTDRKEYWVANNSMAFPYSTDITVDLSGESWDYGFNLTLKCSYVYLFDYTRVFCNETKWLTYTDDGILEQFYCNFTELLTTMDYDPISRWDYINTLSIAEPEPEKSIPTASVSILFGYLGLSIFGLVFITHRKRLAYPN